MNNYDDIKRFIEKTNLEGIDYKELSGQEKENPAQNWAILRQLSDTPAAPGGSQRTTQPPPVAAPAQEFATSGLLAALASQQPVAVAPPATPVPPPAAAPAAPEPATPAAPAAEPAYTQLFRQKRAPAPVGDARRDTLLQPLLEMIATCR
ncbi:cellulose biosynthesis protein BcsO [Nissabacter sp. SGAir0207]|uniref:cellulose biosynthesis protein BcsO n=1 Tax=Nissabacter sp. SGAir0207 TaxID=2126321 RepID=UPI0010CCC741|nr:cellulose biosynthesis protein BcsO [Nissabacter sp. SGAir0207]QCR34668.1 hypothetical protein C1N62_00485 [Nissabacter sp. SGAir0207]